MNDAKLDCYKCIHKRNVPGDAHIRCNNVRAKVIGNSHGIAHGWFLWPINFDPVWLTSCDGFSSDPKDELPDQSGDSFVYFLNMLATRK